MDNSADNCAAHKKQEWCTSTGDYGPNWPYCAADSRRCTFEDYAVNGQTALVCPECGCREGI